MSDTKECPQCAELVKARARICRFCGHTFAEEAVPPEALQLDLTDTATVIFVGRLRGSTLEPTHLRMYFFRPEEKRYIEIKPRAVAGNAGWTPEGDQIVARAGSGRRALLASHTVYSSDSRNAAEDAPVQIEFLVETGAGRIEVGWASMMTRQDGMLMLDPTGCGSVPASLEPGQVLVIDIGPVLGHRGRDGHADLGYCGPPGTSRREPVVHIAAADLDAHAARWSGVAEVAPPSGRQVDPMLVVTGPLAQQRWGHGGSVFQADAEASGAALGAKLGAMYVEKKRKKALLEGARGAVATLVKQAVEGECALLDERLSLRDNFAEVSASAAASLAEAQAVRSEWERLSDRVSDQRSASAQATAAVAGMASQLGTAIRAALDRGDAVAGASELVSADAEVRQLNEQHAALDNVSGFFAKAKAAAQQLALKAQIALAENKRNRAQTAAATALIERGEEASVPGAEAVIEAIAAKRSAAAAAADQLAEAEAAREAATPALVERLGIDRMPAGGPAAVVSEREAALAGMSEEVADWVERTTAALIEAGPAAWPADGALREALDDHAMKVSLS